MFKTYFWVLEALMGVVALVGLQYGAKKIITRMEKKGMQGWRLRIGKIFLPPVSLLIWALIGLYLMDVFGRRFDFAIALNYLHVVRKAAVVGCFAWLFFRWKSEIEQTLLTDPARKIDLTTAQIIGRLATLAVGIITTLIILQIFGVNTAPLLAFGSIGAASLGFAAKDVIANFCSGIMLQIARPFVRGDQILLPEKHLEGFIEEIGWFKTTIRDTEKRAVYLPNNYFSTLLVVNASRITHKRLKQTVKVPLDSIEKMALAIPKIREAIVQTRSIDSHYPIHVYLKTFGDYACEIEIEAVSTITDLETFNRLQQEILLKVYALLDEMKIPLAIPSMNLKGYEPMPIS